LYHADIHAIKALTSSLDRKRPQRRIRIEQPEANVSSGASISAKFSPSEYFVGNKHSHSAAECSRCDFPGIGAHFDSEDVVSFSEQMLTNDLEATIDRPPRRPDDSQPPPFWNI
jgi:hypothetical protein